MYWLKSKIFFGEWKTCEAQQIGLNWEQGELRRDHLARLKKIWEQKRRCLCGLTPTSEVKPGPELRRLVSKAMPKPADEHCWEERARWHMMEHLQEQLRGKKLVYVQLQFKCHLFLSTDLDLVQNANTSIASPPILKIELINLHQGLQHGLSVTWTVHSLPEENKWRSGAALLSLQKVVTYILLISPNMLHVFI